MNDTEPTREGDHRHRAFTVLAAAAFLLAALLLPAPAPAADEAPRVALIPLEGVIDPEAADYVVRSIGAAEESGATAVVITLDTHGGLDSSMREIVEKMAASPLPVIAYVHPTGAHAASAGTFILMAADLAAMAPGTVIGAAHPVAAGIDPDSEEAAKILNDTTAYMRSLAEANGRDADWAELAVRQSISATAEEAQQLGVVDMTADSVESLLVQADGFTTRAKGIELKTGGAVIEEAEMSLREQVLHFVLDPNVVFMLLLLGLLAVAYEFAHPGVGIGALTGLVALGLATFALLTLPVNLGGLALVATGFLLLVADLYVPSYGLLSAGGVAAIVAGSVVLFDADAPFLEVSLPLSIVLALLTGAFFIFIVRAAVKARRLPARTGGEAMVGERGYARTLLSPRGQVQVRGEIWNAETEAGETIADGEEVEVTAVAGLTLRVKKTD